MICVLLLYINKVYMLYKMTYILNMVVMDALEVEIKQFRVA